jgi:predicted phosphodiesterase
MRFAVISDVQGNLSALQAVLDEIDALPRRIDRIVCAGDAVGLGPHPNEVIDLLRAREIEAVRGNYDDAVAFERMSSGVDFPNADAEAADQQAVEWTRRTLTGENLAYVQKLPRDLRLSPAFSGTQVKRDPMDDTVSEYRRTYFARALFGGLFRPARTPGKRVMVVHGSPRALNEFVRADTANSILTTIAREAQVDVVISGHAGVSFQRPVAGVTFVGVGSVSGPNSVSGQAEYAVVEVKDTVEVEFGSASYDPTEHVNALAARRLTPYPVSLSPPPP